MNTLKGILMVLCLILAVVLGIGGGIGIFSYSIWLIFLMVTGKLAVTFFGIVKVVLLWGGAGLGGWLIAMLFFSLACFFGFRRD